MNKKKNMTSKIFIIVKFTLFLQLEKSNYE